MTNNDNTIYGYSINNATGELTKIAGSPFTITSGASRGIAVDPSGKFLYIASSAKVLWVWHCCRQRRVESIIQLSLYGG
jgi:DNA-binding beta-propeller fold protein YncE